jgi:hypothetical protein
LWTDLLAALALVLVIEGLLPFASPVGWRRVVLMVARMDDRTLRFVGLSSIIVGLALLTLVRMFA